MDVPVHFKGCNTTKSLLVDPKNKDNVTQNSGVICSYKCDWLQWDEEYLGESAKTSRERLKEHLRDLSPKLWPRQHHMSSYKGWTTSTLWTGSLTSSQAPSSRLCTSGSICPTFGMSTCSTPLISNSNSPFHNFVAHCTWPTPPWWQEVQGAHSLCQYFTTLDRYVVWNQQLDAIPFGTRCHSLHNQWCHLW